ncbi:MAG: ribose-phosphate diphosphokinase [Rhodoferax sp.]|nr:ribose-phosphate diphosphokinase [Rhodoferax sp.]
MLLYFDDERDAALRLADAASLQAVCIDRHHFPDGELKLRLPARLPGRVTLYRSLDQPNEKLVELLIASQTARSLGATHLALVAPYLAYMRQDMEFSPGEAVSQRIVGRFLASLFDAIVTVDPHLHRINRLEEAAPVAHAVVLVGALPLSDHVVRQRAQPLLVGPDAESEQWVAAAAARHGLDFTICSKVRSGDRDVAVDLPPARVAGRAAVILDDMASTGHTIAAAARLLQAAGAGSIDAAVTHALFTPQALDMLRASGVGEVWSTDCINHPSNAVAMAPMLAQALRDISAGSTPGRPGLSG